MIRVLVVEEHEIVRDALAAFLGHTPGIQVTGVASSIRDAVPTLENLDPDIVLADLSLDDGSAGELVRATRRSGFKARIVAITGFSDASAAAAVLACGVAAYVLKSQPSAELLTAIRNVAAGRSYVLPQVAARPSAGSGDETSSRPEHGMGLALLSQREQEIFRHVVHGHSHKEIARRLFISPKTVESHRTNINRKLALRTTADLVPIRGSARDRRGASRNCQPIDGGRWRRHRNDSLTSGTQAL